MNEREIEILFSYGERIATALETLAASKQPTLAVAPPVVSNRKMLQFHEVDQFERSTESRLIELLDYTADLTGIRAVTIAKQIAKGARRLLEAEVNVWVPTPNMEKHDAVPDMPKVKEVKIIEELPLEHRDAARIAKEFNTPLEESQKLFQELDPLNAGGFEIRPVNFQNNPDGTSNTDLADCDAETEAFSLYAMDWMSQALWLGDYHSQAAAACALVELLKEDEK